MKAQSAMEYTIILAVSLILLAFVARVIITGTSEAEQIERQSKIITMEALPIGITSYAISSEGITLELTNNFDDRITITNITINGTHLNSTDLPMHLIPKEQRSIRSYSLLLMPDTYYKYPISINYTDHQLGIQRTWNVDNVFLEGQGIRVDNEIDTSENIADSLAGLWHMNEDYWNGSQSQAIDSSANGRHANSSGTADTVGGLLAMSGSFSSDGYIDIAQESFMDGSTQITVCGWVNLDSLGSSSTADASIFGERVGVGTDAIVLWYNWQADSPGDKKYTFNVGTTADSGNRVSTTGPATAGMWQHICGMMDGTRRSIYLNGELNNTHTSGDATYSVGGDANPRIGSYHPQSDFYLDGMLDEVAIWNRTLTPEEIYSLYFRGFAAMNS